MSNLLKIAGGIVCFATFALYYHLAWNEVIDNFILNKIFSYGEFMGVSLVFTGLFLDEKNKKVKYLIYNTLSVFFFSLILAYGFQDLVVYVFKSENETIKNVFIYVFKEDSIKGILKGYNKLYVTLVITSMLCVISPLFWLKRF